MSDSLTRAARQPEDPRRLQWTPERIARLGFLIGLGWDAKRIADDRVIASPTTSNVHRQAQRFGLAFRAAPESPWALPPRVNAKFDAAAAKRELPRAALIRRLLMILAEEKHLLDNVLDDDLDEPIPPQIPTVRRHAAL